MHLVRCLRTHRPPHNQCSPLRLLRLAAVAELLDLVKALTIPRGELNGRGSRTAQELAESVRPPFVVYAPRVRLSRLVGLGAAAVAVLLIDGCPIQHQSMPPSESMQWC